jgi:hypothetical protein
MHSLDKVARGFHLQFCACLRTDLSFPNEELPQQSFPLANFNFHFFRRILFVQIVFLEFLLQRADVLARRPQSALHDKLLSFLGKQKVDEKKRCVGIRRLGQQRC